MCPAGDSSTRGHASQSKVRILLYIYPLALTDWQVAQARLQDYHADRTAAASRRAGILWQQYGGAIKFQFLPPRTTASVFLCSDLFADTSQANKLVGLSSPYGRMREGWGRGAGGGGGGRMGGRYHQVTSHLNPCRVFSRCRRLLLRPRPWRPSTPNCLTSSPFCVRCSCHPSEALPRPSASFHHGKHPGSDGLPYEFCQAFWPLLGPPLLAVLIDAFESAAGFLTPTKLLGIIVLLYNGTCPRSDPPWYRPFTLLNADAKLFGEALTDRWGAPVSTVVDTTQAAFLRDG